jgi:predicted ATPase/Tfp pilus assembly protein PilF
VVHLKALGGLRLESTGSQFTQLKPLLLLTYLSVEGGQPRKHLAELFWPEGDRMKSLGMSLLRLRQGLGEGVESDDKKAWTSVSSDVKALLTALDKSQWQRANELYTGAFLEGAVLESWSNELEEWVYTTREYLAERVQYALLNLAEEAAQHQDFARAGQLAERAYRLPGLAGTDLTNLKRLYPLLCAGENLHAPDIRKEAEGYGVTLQITTREARGTFKPTTRPSTLPVRGTSFVGRDEELAELATLLSKSNLSLLTLLGPAGVGKTRLALQLAHEQQKLGTFKDGVYFVQLDALSDSSLIASTLLSHLGLTQQGKTEALTQLTNFIAERNILLVLDNFEHLSEGSSLLSELLSKCPKLILLVTSRERLNLEEEHVFTLEGLSYPEILSVNAKLSEAVQLFIERAQQVQPRFEIDKNLNDVIRICGLVEGLPLGIELSASWVRMMSCKDIAAEIEKGLELLTSVAKNVPKRHRSLKAAFEQSWKLLTSKEQEVLRKLSVFFGGFRREAASEVAGATIPILASLVDKSLLRVLPNGRYERHLLLYQFTQEKLAAQVEEETKTKERHGYYFMQFLAELRKDLEGSEQQKAREVIGEELNNIRSSWLIIIASADEARFMKVCESLAHYFSTTGQTIEGVALFKLGLHHFSQTTQAFSQNPKHTMLLFAKASLLYRSGNFAEVSRLGREVLTAFQRLGDDYGTMKTYHLLGRSALREGNYDAEKWHEQGLTLAKRLADDSALALSFSNLADMCNQRGKFMEAKQYYKQALTLYQKLGNPTSQVYIANNLGDVHLGLGELGEAKRYVEEGLHTAKLIGFQAIVPYFLYNLAVIAKRQEAYEASESYCSEALTLTRTTHDKSLEASILGMLGVVASKVAKVGEAYRYLQESLRVAQEIADLPVLVENLFYVAQWHEHQGNVPEAVTLASFVAQHPACTGHNRTLAKEFCDRLQSEVHEDSVALAQGDQDAKLETLITTILSSEPIMIKSVKAPVARA